MTMKWRGGNWRSDPDPRRRLCRASWKEEDCGTRSEADTYHRLNDHVEVVAVVVVASISCQRLRRSCWALFPFSCYFPRKWDDCWDCSGFHPCAVDEHASTCRGKEDFVVVIVVVVEHPQEREVVFVLTVTTTMMMMSFAFPSVDFHLENWSGNFEAGPNLYSRMKKRYQP